MVNQAEFPLFIRSDIRPDTYFPVNMLVHFTFDAVYGILRSQLPGNLNDKSLMDYYAAVKAHSRILKPNITLLEFRDIVQ
jgi:hypothetical protein